MNNYLKKDLNFFACIGRERGLGAIDFEKALKKCLIVFAAIFGVVLLICLSVNGVKKGKIKKLNADIEALQEDLKLVDQYKTESEELQADIDRFNQAIADFNVSPRLTTEDIKNIAKAMPTGLSLTSFTYSGNTINLGVSGSTELMVADYAHNLRDSKTEIKGSAVEGTANTVKSNFKDVQYSGVSKNGNIYTGNITVTLNDIVVETTTEAAAETTTAAQ